MAATPLEALEDLYGAVVPALPRLYVGQLRVAADRPAPPYALLAHHSRPDMRVQAGASVGGKTGVQSETLLARFTFWDTDPATVDTAASNLVGALTPKAAVVAGANTFLVATIGGPDPERRGQSRRPGAPQRPVGNVDYTDRLYAAVVNVKMRVDYT